MRKLHFRVITTIAVVVLGVAPLRAAFAADPELVEDLRAFAKLYGYVRFFHPSDQAAEVDWETFAVDGAARILEADGSDDLEHILDELFGGIAPTVQILRTDGPPPWNPNLSPRDHAAEVVAWQHRGVGVGDWWYQSRGAEPFYLSIRTNRPNFIPQPDDGGSGVIVQSFSAASLVGRDVRLRAAARAQVEGPGNGGHLWLRVDLAGDGSGFFDNMWDRPVKSPDWDHYEIVGSIAANAQQIFFGAFLDGFGIAHFDDFSLETRQPGGQWQVTPITNPGFEDHISQPQGWGTGSTEYSYTVDDTDPFAGSQSLGISRSAQATPAPDLLFDQVPPLGERVLKELGPGLWAAVPVALPVQSVRRGSRRLAPSGGGKAIRRAPTGESSKVQPSATAERVAAMVIAWNVFQHFYPYFDVIDTDWDEELTTALTAALDAQDDLEFYYAVKLLMAALHDGHGRTYHDDISWTETGFPFLVDWIEKQVVVTASEVPEVEIGDVVVSVDGVSATALADDDMQYHSGSTQWKRYLCMRYFGRGDPGSTAEVVLRRGNDNVDVTLQRSGAGSLVESRPQALAELEDGIYYVDLERVSSTNIDSRASELAAAAGVVFDVRGSPNVFIDFIGYLNNEQVLGHINAVPQTIYPDRERIAGWDIFRSMLEPVEPRFQGVLVFLTDARAISYAETVLGIVEAYGIAEIVGRTTAGTNGAGNALALPGGFKVYWTGAKVLKHDGSRFHLVGISPTVSVTRTIAAVRAGRDEDIEAAIEIIKQRRGIRNTNRPIP
jgi:C-terminal processing protease CtpA/Prc